MKNKITLPRSEDLYGHPQLAILAVLEAATDIAIPALGAAYPELGDLDLELHHHELAAARRVVDLARALAVTLRQYKRVLRDARRREEDRLPF